MPKAKTQQLNPKQEMFCQLYATEREFFGNGVQAYIEAYDPDMSKKNWYKAACASASRLLANAKVCDRINQLLELGGLNDQFVDKQLSFLITQHADFGAKMRAIAEYNKLKTRIIERRELTGKDGGPVESAGTMAVTYMPQPFTDDELEPTNPS